MGNTELINEIYNSVSFNTTDIILMVSISVMLGFIVGTLVSDIFRRDDEDTKDKY